MIKERELCELVYSRAYAIKLKTKMAKDTFVDDLHNIELPMKTASLNVS